MMLDAINWHSCFFLLFAAIACSFALAVVVSSNVVRMAFYLIVSLGSVAALFFLAGAEFVGAMQLMIYVGGTLVLLAFGVMLTARGPLVSIPTGGGQWILATIVGGSLLVVLVQTALSVGDWRGPATPQAAADQPATAPPLGLAMLGVRADQLDESNPGRREGMSGYLLPFEIVSVHLLVVLIGAAYLARAKR
jgi:NADH:ubiquinone oxidoreductase subunit 6 (subunit J)